MKTNNKKNYLIATAIGGVMEKPEFSYENFRNVIASSREEAVEIYYSYFPRDYWFAHVFSENPHLEFPTITEKKPPAPTTAELKKATEEAWFSKQKGLV
jgi:hypothetical protein